MADLRTHAHTSNRYPQVNLSFKCINIKKLSNGDATKLTQDALKLTYQLGISALSFPRNMIPTLVAWWMDE
jgi:hypothetical protein